MVWVWEKTQAGRMGWKNTEVASLSVEDYMGLYT